MTAAGGGGLAEVIYLPGVTAPPVDAAREADARLPGETASPTESARQRGPAASTHAENVAMHALTRRGQSRRELEAILRSRELDPDTIEAELERLEGVGLIDDHALAEELVRRGRERKGLGRAALAAQLRRRKLDPDAIDAALEATDADDELARATELAIARATRLSGLDRDTVTRRLSGYLQRKGYSGDTVRAAVTTALDGAKRTVQFR